MKEVGFVIQQRPYPPEWVFALDTPNFAPAPELWRWIKSIFLNPEHKLFNPDHAHLGAFYYPLIAVMGCWFEMLEGLGFLVHLRT